MRLNQKYNIRTESPLPFSPCSLWLKLVPAEVAAAFASGTGPGVPDATTGTVALGTIKPGLVVNMDTSGNAVLMTSGNIATGMPVMPFVVHAGDDDFSGAESGVLLTFHGNAVIETDQYDTADTFAPGDVLVATAGKWDKKASATDHIQACGVVAPEGLRDGVLTVIVVPGVWGY